MNVTHVATVLAVCSLSVASSFTPVRGQTPDAPNAAAHVVTVHMRDSIYDPTAINVHVGDTVVFVNEDEIRHNVTSDALKSGNIDGGKSWQFTVPKAGTYTFVCTYHPWMKGTITAVNAGG